MNFLRCTFENNESCLEWYDRLLKAAEPPKQLDQLFAFYYHVWTKEKEKDIYNSKCLGKDDTFNKKMFENEVYIFLLECLNMYAKNYFCFS